MANGPRKFFFLWGGGGGGWGSRLIFYSFHFPLPFTLLFSFSFPFSPLYLSIFFLFFSPRPAFPPSPFSYFPFAGGGGGHAPLLCPLLWIRQLPYKVYRPTRSLLPLRGSYESFEMQPRCMHITSTIFKLENLP